MRQHTLGLAEQSCGELLAQARREWACIGGLLGQEAALKGHPRQPPQTTKEALGRVFGHQQVAVQLYIGQKPTEDGFGFAGCGEGQEGNLILGEGQAGETPRALCTVWPMRFADSGPQIHEGLVEGAWPKGGARGEAMQQSLNQALHTWKQPCLWQGPSIEASEDAQQVAVYGRDRQPESHGSHRPRRIGAKPRQSQQGLEVGGKLRLPLGDELLCCGMQFAAAAIIAQALPKGEDFVQRCGRKALQVGKAPHKPPKIAHHRPHLSLLQHDFTHPNGIGLSMVSPGELASMLCIPCFEAMEQLGRGGFGSHRKGHRFCVMANVGPMGEVFWVVQRGILRAAQQGIWEGY